MPCKEGHYACECFLEREAAMTKVLAQIADDAAFLVQKCNSSPHDVYIAQRLQIMRTKARLVVNRKLILKSGEPQNA